MAHLGERVTKLEQAMARLTDADEELRRAIADGWRQIEKTDRQIEKTDRQIERTDRQIERTDRQIEETDRQIRATQKHFDESQKRLEESRVEADRQRTELNRKLGELSHKMGWLAEDLVAPSVPTVFREVFGVDDLEMSAPRLRRRHRRDPGRTREFDYVAVAGPIVMVTETKSRLRPEDIPAFVRALGEVREYLPDADGRDVVGSLASLSVDPSLVVAGERQGLLMFGLGTGLLRVLNSPDFKPRRF